MKLNLRIPFVQKNSQNGEIEKKKRKIKEEQNYKILEKLQNK